MPQRFLALLFCAIAYCVGVQPLQAQTPGSSTVDYDRQFYVLASRGLLSGVKVDVVQRIRVPSISSWQVGGGTEWFMEGTGFAFGGEFMVSPDEYNGKPITYIYRASDGNQASKTIEPEGVEGWLSLNMSYHFKELSPRRRKIVPFVTAGITAFARDEPDDAFNIGGGISIWRTRHRGWRLEYVSHLVRSDHIRLRSVRVGLMLR